MAITVSESTGTVRLFQNGEVMLRIEPFRRAMKWIDFDVEPAPSGGEGMTNAECTNDELSELFDSSIRHSSFVIAASSSAT